MSAGRYANAKPLDYTSPGGVTVQYLPPRTLAAPGPPAARTTVGAAEAGRLDLIAYRTLGDALAAWRVADANLTTSPMRLVREPGASVDLPGTAL